MDSAAGSDAGKRRPRNEDAFLEDAARGLYVVADGMGGHPAGDVASEVAIRALDEALAERTLSDDDLMRVLSDALIDAHRKVVEAADVDPGRRGMGTTAVVAHLTPDCRLLTCAHIGDSRAYVKKGQRLVRVTEDHVVGSPRGRMLSQAIGTSGRVEPEAAEVDLNAGDRVLLCTDGLTDMLADGEIADLLSSDPSAQRVCDRLIQRALDRGGHDNVTCIVIDV